MSYCVNCGVELETTIEECPLCNTPVVNPSILIKSIEKSPFPKESGQVDVVKRKDLAILLTTVLVATALGCGLLNLFVFSSSSWSLSIIGICILIWVFAIPAVIYTKISIYSSIILDGIFVMGYLFLLTLMTKHNNWYFSLALPIVTITTILIILLIFLLKHFHIFILNTALYIFAELGILCVCIELFIKRFLHQDYALSWSAVVLVVCSIIVAALITLIAKKRLRNEVRRRLHF